MENQISSMNQSQSKVIFDKSDGKEFNSTKKEPYIKSYDLISSWNSSELIE
jgi:hypothetical protein